jgi:hypothetical protein
MESSTLKEEVVLLVKCKEIDVSSCVCIVEEQNKDKTWKTIADVTNISGDFKRINMTFHFEK